jgi:hypothetical protein
VARAEKSPGPTRLDGVWRLVSYKSSKAREHRKVPQGLEQIKLVSGGRFTVMMVKEGKVVQAMAGQCAVGRAFYLERITFVLDKQDEWMVGIPTRFKWALDGDKWSHEGVIRGARAEAQISEVWERLKPQDGKAASPRGGFLGINVHPLDGVAEVREVIKGCAAEKAGLKSKDVIIAVDGKAIPDGKTLSETLQKYKAGDRIRIKVRRGEEEVELNAVLTERPG